MRTALFTTLILAVSALALPALTAYHDQDGELIMALNDNGDLYELTAEGWSMVGTPCPGTGPFSIELIKSETASDEVYIFVFDSEGNFYQYDGETWLEIRRGPENAVSPCLAAMWEVSAETLQAFMVDARGTIFITGLSGDNSDLMQNFPAAPAQDLTIFFDPETATLIPFLLGVDGYLYTYVDGEWTAADGHDEVQDLISTELMLNPKSGTIFMMGIDQDGNLYDNLEGGYLAPAPVNPCPGQGPWVLDLVPIDASSFEALCIDARGAFYIFRDNDWQQFASDFPEN